MTTRAGPGLLVILCAAAIATAAPTPAHGQKKATPKRTPVAEKSPQKSGSGKKPTKRPRRGKRGKRGGDSTKVFDFTGLDLVGRLRSPQLLYFLDRASQELELASLKRRSFIPEMVRSVDEEAL